MADERIGIAIDAINNASAVLKQVQNDLKALDGQSKSTSSSMDSFSSSLGGISSQLAGIGAGLTATLTVPLTLLGKTMVEQVGNIEQLRVAFDTMLGSAEAGAKALNDVQQFAAKTPFDLPQVAAGAKQLLAFGTSTQDLIPTLKSLGDVSAGLNVPLERIILNYGQIQVQGKLTGRELRDFSTAGVPLIETLAKQFGKTRSEITDMVSEGRIGFKDVEKAFQSMTGEGGRFFNLMEKQSKTLQGVVSNIKDNFVRLSLSLLGVSTEANNFGEIIEGGPFSKLKDIAQGILENFGKVVEAFNKLDIETKNTIVGVGIFIASLGPLALIAAGITAAFAALATPIGLILTAFAAAGVSVVIFRDKLVEIVSFLKPFTDAVVQFASTLGNTLYQAILLVINAFGGWEGIKLIIQGVTVALTFLLNTLSSIIGILGTVFEFINSHFKEFATIVSVVAVAAITLFAQQIKVFLVVQGKALVEGLINAGLAAAAFAETLVVKTIPALVSSVAAMGPLALALGGLAAAIGIAYISLSKFNEEIAGLQKHIQEGIEGNKQMSKSFQDLAAISNVFDNTIQGAITAQEKTAELNQKISEKIALESEYAGLGIAFNKEKVDGINREIAGIQKELDTAISAQKKETEARVKANGEIFRNKLDFTELSKKVSADEYKKIEELIIKRKGVEDGVNKALLAGAVGLTEEKIKIIEKYNLKDKQLIIAAANIDANTLKERLRYIQQYRIDDFNIKQAILSASNDLSVKDLDVFRKNVDDKLAQVDRFKIGVDNALANPTIKTILLDIKTIGGPGIGNFLQQKAEEAKNFLVDGLKKLAVKSEAEGLAQQKKPVLEPPPSLGGGGGESKKITAQKKEVSELSAELEKLGEFSIKEGGKVVDTFDDIGSGVDKVKQRLKDLNTDNETILKGIEKTGTTIKDALKIDFKPLQDNFDSIKFDPLKGTFDKDQINNLFKTVSNFDDLKNVLKEVDDKVQEVNDHYEKFVEDAVKDSDQLTEKIKDVNKQFAELEKQAAKDVNKSLAEQNAKDQSDLAQLLRDIEKATDDVQTAQKSLSDAQAQGDAEAIDDATRKLAQSQADLKTKEDLKTKLDENVKVFKELVDGTKDYGKEIEESTAKVEKLQEAVKKLKEDKGSASEIVAAEKAVATEQENQFILLGKQLSITGDRKDLVEAIALEEAKAHLSNQEFILYNAGLEETKRKELQAQKIKDLQDLQKVQQLLISGALTKSIVDEKTGLVDTKKAASFTEGLQKQGLGQDALDFAQRAVQEETEKRVSLERQAEILLVAKKKEVEIYNSTNEELKQQQTKLEEYLKLSYDNLIVKLKEVEKQALATAAALRSAGGGGGSTSPAPVKQGKTGGFFASGGFTANIGENTPAGIVHGGEWVAPKWMVDKFRGLFGQLDQMRENKIAGFLNGGMVDNSQQKTYNQPITMNNTIHEKIDFEDVASLLAWKLRTS